MAKGYSYVIRNPRTKVTRQWLGPNPYYYKGDLVKFEGELWVIWSRNFGG